MNYVAFDIGNVIVHADFSQFINQLSETLNITIQEATYFMNRNQKLHDLGLTTMSDELHDHFKIKSEVIIDKLIKSWNNVINPSYSVAVRINRLSNEHNLKVALLSNVGPEHSQRMQEVLSCFDFWNEAVKHFSCEVGARKPSLLYYQSFLTLHPEWKGCPYVDDLPENLKTGAQFGFKPFQFSLEEYADWRDSGIQDKLNEIEEFVLGHQSSEER